MVERRNGALEGPVKARYVKRWDSELNALLPYAAIQPFWRSGLTGEPIEQAETAANDADTESESGNPSLSGILQIQEVDATVVTDGLAFGTITRGRYDIQPFPVGELSDPTAWVERGVMPVRRYFVNGSSALADEVGEACSGGYIDVPVPYAIFAFREAATQTKPTGIFDGVGEFTTIEGASMMRLTPELRVYQVGGTVQYVLTRFYEWRATQPANGWIIHSLTDSNTLALYSITAGE